MTRDTALFDEDYYASQYKLTYDEDGYLRWSPVWQKLTLVILCDGEQHLGWNADGKLEYKPFFVQGHEDRAYDEYVRLCITYADSQLEVSAKEILGSFKITENGSFYT